MSFEPRHRRGQSSERIASRDTKVAGDVLIHWLSKGRSRNYGRNYERRDGSALLTQTPRPLQTCQSATCRMRQPDE